jgi:hypothetical protein
MRTSTMRPRGMHPKSRCPWRGSGDQSLPHPVHVAATMPGSHRPQRRRHRGSHRTLTTCNRRVHRSGGREGEDPHRWGRGGGGFCCDGGWLVGRSRRVELRAGEERSMHQACLRMQLVILSCLLGEKRGKRTNLYVSCVTLNDRRIWCFR